ncbi:MAG: NADH-quinone oxidoreductase subunit NuoK [Candidatus Kapaibacterium sp.]
MLRYSRCAVALDNVSGQALVLFVMAVIAAEAAIGLAILIAIFRKKETILTDNFNILKN